MIEEGEIEKGIMRTRRKVFTVGDSKAVTLPKKWLDVQKWLGNEISEVSSLAMGDMVVLVPPGKEERTEGILREIERRGG